MGQQNIGNVQLATFPLYGTDLTKGTTGQNLPADRTQFQFKEKTAFGGSVVSTPAAGQYFLYQADGAGQLTGFHGSVITPGSAASVTIDLYKNGISILSALITLTNSTTARAVVNATLSQITFNAGDLFTGVLAVGSSTGMQGVQCWLNGYEYAQPL